MPEDLRELRFNDLLQIGEILFRFERLDIPKPEIVDFIQKLTRDRNSWFVEAARVGIMYLTDVTPGRDATFFVIFWDKSLALDRVAAVKMFVADAFERFDLSRISAHICWSNRPMDRFLRDVGFVLEGVTRRGWSVNPPEDLIHYGILREEKPEGTLPLEFN